MERKLCLIVCNYFLPEASQIIKSGEYEDIVIKSFQSSCTGASLTDEKIRNIIKQYTSVYSKVIFIGSSCLALGKNEGNIYENTKIVQLDQCFELLVNSATIEYLIRKKYYIVSNGWLSDYKNHIRNWGFDPLSAKKFFNESAEKIILLETGLNGDYQTQLEALSEYMGLPYEIFPVGLSHCKLFLNSIISQWRIENERDSTNEKLANAFTRAADYALAFNQLNYLIDLVDESEIVTKIFNFLNILFFPSNIIYAPITDAEEKKQIFFKNEINKKEEFDTASFCIELWSQKELLGVFKIFGIANPQYIEKYKEISQIIGSIGGLAVANARKFMKIKEDEKQIRQHSLELKELNATKDKFFSIIAHDLKSPFTGFISLTEILTDGFTQFSKVELSKFFKEMNKSANNIYKLLVNLLDWAKMQQGTVSYDPKEILLVEVVLNNIDLINKRGEQKGIDIIFNNIANQKIYADTSMLNAIMRNLLSNAVKFTTKGGKIIINAKEIENKMIQISVSDTGIGMSDAFCKRLFKLEEKVGRKGTDGEDSTGLGLLLCKEFVEKHGGKIWAESEENVGSTFHFTLPLQYFEHRYDCSVAR